MSVEDKIKWLECCRVKSGAYFLKRLANVQAEINRLEHFVDLRVNEKIQSYWYPIFQDWRERLTKMLSQETRQ